MSGRSVRFENFKFYSCLLSLLFFIWTIIPCPVLANSNVSIRCDELSKNQKFPQVFVYNASGYDVNVGTTPNYDTNGTVTFKTDGSEVVRLGLECRHNRPIKWIFDGDFVSKGFREIHTNCSRTIDKNAFEDTEKYEYLARYEFEFSNFANPLIFICETVSSPCERGIVISAHNQFNQDYTVTLLSKTDTSTSVQSEVADFDRKLKLSQTGAGSGDTAGATSKCVSNLTLSADIERIFYNWDPVEDYQGPYSILDPQSFENYFRFVEPQNQECTEYFNEPEDLPCMKMETCGYVEHGGRPQALYYVKGDHRRVVKGFFDLTEEEIFCKHDFPWDPIDPLDFVFVNTPTEAFIGQVVQVQCHTSPVFFAHGSLIALNLQENSPQFASWQTEEVFLSETGTRNITGKVHLTRSVFEGLGDEYVNMSCYAPVWNSSDWIVKSEPVLLLDSIDPSVQTSVSRTAVTDEPFLYTFSCEGFGIPIPSLEIIPPKQNLNFTTSYENGTSNSSVILTVSFDKPDMNYEGFYNCVATSVVGTQFELYNLKLPAKGLSSFLKLIIIAFGSILIIFLLVVFGLVGKLMQNREDYRRKKALAIKDFQEGFRNTESTIPVLGYDKDKYEVPLFMWDLGGTMIGSGAFGKVHKGYVRTEIGRQLVAIKIVNCPKDVEDFRLTLMELAIMSYMGAHDNVVSLVAACVENIEKASLLIGVEYCTNGSLDFYLRKRRPLFHNFVKNGKLSLGDGRSHGPYTNIIATANFSTLDLCKWSYQIANGMEFLESKKVLHADLATRNVLISQDKIAKICDFGLSRTLTQSSDYTKTTKVKLPWRWMAPESLRHMQFSSKSDIWSFGVTLWEIFSLGDEPWPYELWTTEYMDELEYGKRLNQPQFCTDKMFSAILMECWRNEPGERISFKTSRSFFEEVIVQLSSSLGNSDDFLAQF